MAVTITEEAITVVITSEAVTVSVGEQVHAEMREESINATVELYDGTGENHGTVNILGEGA